MTIDGKSAGPANGLTVSSAGNPIRGLTIVGFSGDGIQITGSGNVIGGDRSVGTGPNGQGLRLAGNGAFGIEITDTHSSANVIKGCGIGLDASGQAPQANLAGIAIQGGAHDNSIGGVLAGEARSAAAPTRA